MHEANNHPVLPPEADSAREWFAGDALARMRVHALALRLSDDAWADVDLLARHPATRQLADQLYRALGSIGANLAEGYSRSSSRDRARFYEYALGSARESREWYARARFRLGTDAVGRRMLMLNAIARMLLAILRRSHGHDRPNARFDH